jgi:hypothetical protein
MITLGVILYIVGLIAKVAILQTLGLVLAVAGLALLLLGRSGRAIGGRHHYW